MTVNGEIDTVISLERELQIPAVRQDRTRILDLLAEDFTEINGEGRLHTRETILDLLDREVEGSRIVDVVDISGRAASENAIVVVWESRRGHIRARRSSLWQHRDTRWQLVHHQVTPLPSDLS